MVYEAKFNVDVTAIDKGETAYLRDEKLFGYVKKGFEEKPFDVFGPLEIQFNCDHPTVPVRIYHVANSTVSASIQRTCPIGTTMLFVNVASSSIVEAEATKSGLERAVRGEIERNKVPVPGCHSE